jgi:tetraacyldisaccharide 4'-kinase
VVFDEAAFREVISGRRRGVRAALVRAALRAGEAPYGWAVRWRNWRYDTHRAAVHRVAVPVVSVGNITLGGTGKTPMVEWLARWFAGRGVAVGIVSRGYRAAAGGLNDEAIELSQKLPGVPHVQNPDRVAGARAAIEKHGCRVLVLDDGFQHRRLHRDLNIVLVDALEPFGYGHVFPRGLLREPLSGLHRADIVVLSRSDLVDASRRSEIERIVRQHAPDVVWAEASHRAIELIDSRGSAEFLEWLRGKRVLACCGLGNPAGFRHTLSQCGCEVIGMREFPDHHHYTVRDRQELSNEVGQSNAEALVTTHKDLVKLDRPQLEGRPVWAVRIGIEFQRGGEQLESDLQRCLSPVASAGRATATRV